MIEVLTVNLFDMFGGAPTARNTISNRSSVRGWLESTGLDDLFLSTCGCIWDAEEQTLSSGGETVNTSRGSRGVTTAQPKEARNRRVIKAGTTVDGTPLVIEETSLGIFGMMASLGRNNRYLCVKT